MRYDSQKSDPVPPLCQTNGYELTVRGLRGLLVLTPFPPRRGRIQEGAGAVASLQTEVGYKDMRKRVKKRVTFAFKRF